MRFRYAAGHVWMSLYIEKPLLGNRTVGSLLLASVLSVINKACHG